MKKYLIPLLLAVGFLAGCGSDTPSLESVFPGSLGDLKLNELVLGQEALDRVDQLHGKAIDCDEAAIAFYQGPDDAQANIWVSRHNNEALAREQAAIMLDKMIHPLFGKETPFQDPEDFRYQGVDVYRFQGMGLNHDIFAKDGLVFWISSTPGVSGLVLDGMLAR